MFELALPTLQTEPPKPRALEPVKENLQLIDVLHIVSACRSYFEIDY